MAKKTDTKDDVFDPIAASLRANDPSQTNVAYTSADTGTADDLPAETDAPAPKSEGQTATVNE